MKTVKALSLPVTLAALVISGAALANPAGGERASHSPADKAARTHQTQPSDAAPPEKTLRTPGSTGSAGVGLDASGQAGVRSNTGNLNAPDADLKVGGGVNAEGPKAGKGDSNTSSSR